MSVGRRGHGEGTIFRREDGLWVAQPNLGRDPATGKRRRPTIYGKTRKEVAEKLKQLQRDVDLGVTPNKLTVAAYLDRWLRDSVKPNLRQKTYEQYEYLIRVHIVPTIGAVTLAKLTALDVTHLYTNRRDTGLSGRTVRLVHAVLHRGLAQALRWGMVARNVADAVEPPKFERHEIKPLDTRQVARLLSAAKGERWEALYVLAVASGLRQGELLGLRWEDLDLANGQVHVSRALNRSHAGLAIGEPKSKSARRTVKLPAMAVAALQEHRRSQLEERLRLGGAWQDNGLVFPSTIGTPMDAGNLVRTSFKPLLAKAELPPIRFHDLRHSAATLLLSQGVHPKIVQERLGHSQISLTMDTYSHVLPHMQEEAAEKLERVLAR